MTFENLKPKVSEIVNSNHNRDEKLQNICQLLQDNISYYNWVGFYFANHETKTLHLGPYVGAETDHTVIPFGKRNLWSSSRIKRKFCCARCIRTGQLYCL